MLEAKKLELENRKVDVEMLRVEKGDEDLKDTIRQEFLQLMQELHQ